MPPVRLPGSLATSPGDPSLPGATVVGDGVNFSLRSPAAASAELMLYSHGAQTAPGHVVELDRERHFDHGIWHVHVRGIGAGTHYTWSLDGPDDTLRSGHRFDPVNELVDPYALAVSTERWDRARAESATRPRHASIRAVVVDQTAEPAIDDRPLYIPLEDAIVYELHVGGFTRHGSSGVEHPGTFLGLIEKIPYLKSLGITHVELMPVFAFDEQEVPAGTAERGLRNYWGYSTHSFFALHPGYAVSPADVRTEFRRMVKALHDAGIAVILDVVLNHTAEGGQGGAVINFKGLGNAYFYMLEPEDRRSYRDYTGCGNTVSANHPYVTRFILDCLEFWVREMCVDGFRFDIASALTRDAHGTPRDDAPVVWAIELSPTLQRTHLLAECWDAAGLYQVGSFPGLRWAEWNGRYRDCLRRFVHGASGLHGEVAARISGSADLYQSSGRTPRNTINFITCHDGFTLNDLVSYERKHNRANGEGNRDGTNANWSCNHGTEGPSDDAQVRSLRDRQVRNHLCVLLLSQGVPMLNAGDEVRRTQQGNNNPWCQDNDISWFDWSAAAEHDDMLRFVKGVVSIRQRHPSLRRRRFLTGKPARGGRLPDVEWHGASLHEPAWNDPDARQLCFTLAGVEPQEPALHVIMNMNATARDFALPRLDGVGWWLAVNTAAGPPEDVVAPVRQHHHEKSTCRVEGHSIVVFEGRGGSSG
jgi:isoamylase